MENTIPPNEHKHNYSTTPPQVEASVPSAERHMLDSLTIPIAILAISGITISMASRGRAARVRQDLMDRGLANRKPKMPPEQLKKRKHKRKRK
jgi:hypothetical protein